MLVVESDNDTGSLLKSSLEERCFAVDWERCGERASWLARTNDYDLILLSSVLYNRQGKEICCELRKSGRSVPIIMLAAEPEVSARVEFLNCGADDCVAKQISSEELIARIHAILRRAPSVKSDVLQVDDLVLDIQAQKVIRAQKHIYLTRKEFQLLEYMMRNSHRVLSRGQILEHVWDVDADPFSNTIETHILNLRRKVDRIRGRKLIHTVPGRGYKIGTMLIWMFAPIMFYLCCLQLSEVFY